MLTVAKEISAEFANVKTFFGKYSNLDIECYKVVPHSLLIKRILKEHNTLHI